MTNVIVNNPENAAIIPFYKLNVGDFFRFVYEPDNKKLQIVVSDNEFITIGEGEIKYIQHKQRDVIHIKTVTINYELVG